MQEAVRPRGSVAKLNQLWLNHVDAWGVTLIIGTIGLYLHNAFTPQTLYWLGAITLAYWFAFALNDYYDAPYDARDPEKAQRNFFVGRNKPHRLFWLLLLPTMALVAPAYIQFGRHGVVLFILSLLLMWGYSAPPLRLKSRPGWDLLAHALCVETYPYVSLLLVASLPWTAADGMVLSILFLASLTAQLEQQARDYLLDLETDRNFTTVVGRRRAVLLMRGLTVLLILLTAGYIVAGWVPLPLIPLLLLPLPALLHRLVRPADRPRSQRLVQLLVAGALIYVVGLLIFTYTTATAV